jgi:hypothetical protein
VQWEDSGNYVNVATGKKLTVNNSLTLATTGAVDNLTMTFPNTSATLARIDAANTFTGVQTMTSPALTTPAITGIATGTGVATAATASTLALRDANASLTARAIIPGFTSTQAAGTSTYLTIASTSIQEITGTLSQTLYLPTTGVVAGQQYTIINNSTSVVAIGSSAGNAIGANLTTGTSAVCIALVATPTTAAHWHRR